MQQKASTFDLFGGQFFARMTVTLQFLAAVIARRSRYVAPGQPGLRGTWGAQHHTFTCTQYNAGMNITFALDDELIAAAKAVAAKHGTSVTALVRTALEQQVAVDNDASWMGASGVLQELIDYSLGFKPRSVVMGTLGLDDYGALLRLLNAASLPHPIVPIAKRKAMVAEMKSAIQWAP